MTRLEHGGAIDAAISRFGGARSQWLDLSTGINPVPWPAPAITGEILRDLPGETAVRQAAEAARQAYGAPPSSAIVAAPGTQALVNLLPRMLPGDDAVILCGSNGTYAEHSHCCELAGRRVRFAATPDAVGPGVSLAVLVHPNNPDGWFWNRDGVQKMAERIADGHVVIDESFCDSVPARSFIGDAAPNMIVLRSLGKFFGLAGLRLGFAICSRHIADEIENWLGPWAVSGPALAVAAKAYHDGAWIAASRDWQVHQSRSLQDLLRGAGLEIEGSHSLFVLARHARGDELAGHLARRHILVRHFTDRPQLLRFGLPADRQAMDRLEGALAEAVEAAE